MERAPAHEPLAVSRTRTARTSALLRDDLGALRARTFRADDRRDAKEVRPLMEARARRELR
jgi:hypothetical protein